ncbi:glutaredoxin [Sphingomonas gei]|nr:glutaredoxin [Sphingomonas gei]
MPDRATLYRMVLPEHTCPFGVRAQALLTEHGYQIDDRLLRSREEVEAIKTEHEVVTTPLVFIGDRRIGGCDDLERFLANG